MMIKLHILSYNLNKFTAFRYLARVKLADATITE